MFKKYLIWAARKNIHLADITRQFAAVDKQGDQLTLQCGDLPDLENPSISWFKHILHHVTWKGIGQITDAML